MALLHPRKHQPAHNVHAPHGHDAQAHRHRRKIRLVALDLDGTLLTSKKSISPRTHASLRAALDHGIKIVLATARPPRSVRDYFLALKLDTPTVNYNGALIWDERNSRIIQHVPLEAAVAEKIIAFARKKYPQVLVSVEILDKWYTDHYDDVPEYITETSRRFTPDFIGPLSAFLTVPVTKLMLLGNPKWIDDLEKTIAKKFARHVALVRSDFHLLQLMNPKISKAMALSNVVTSLGIDASEVMAIGDAPNDLHMLQWAGLSLAPANAWDAVKKIAHHVLPSNDHDCVAHALDRFVLHKKSD